MTFTTTDLCDSQIDSSCSCLNEPPALPPQIYLFKSVMFAGGHIEPFFHHMSFSADTVKQSLILVWKAIHPLDVLIFICISYLTIPFFGLIYATYLADDKEIIYPYHHSYLHGFANFISQGAKIAIGIYVLDCLILFLTGLGVYQLEKLSRVVAKVVYISWCAQRFSLLKRHVLCDVFSRKMKNLGRVSIVDRLIDGIIFACTLMFLLEIFEMEMNAGIKSMFAFGSAGTLVIGLASRDLAAMFVSGLALSTSNRVNEGDEIRFGDGTTGKVIKIGWIHTIIQNHDNLIEEVPNSELGMQRVKNLSQIKMCRVQQNLRFHYKDIDKLHKILDDIVEEIKTECVPDVIVDGSKPLRAVWTNYQPDHVQVVVTAHFNAPPIGGKFFEVQQKCLFAIHAAVKKNNVQFATPFHIHQQS